jgi:hypothetical protein
MFKISSNPTFTHQVRVSVPINGGHREETFKAKFNVLPTTKIEEFDLTTPAGTSEFLRAALCGLEEVTDDAGNELPYSDELREKMITIPMAREALFKTYFAAISRARLGN